MNKVDTERLKHLMERMNDFFHQPLNFEKKEEVMSFAMEIYPEIQYVESTGKCKIRLFV